MSLKLGNTELNKLYLGDIDLCKAYLGGTLVFNGLFVSTWRTTTDNETITLPISTNYPVIWGDGTTTTNANSHEYLVSGDYEVEIKGDINDFTFNNLGDKENILEVSNFKGFSINNGSFYGSLNLDITATDNPKIISLFNAFRGCTLLVLNDSVNNWDVSTVTDLTNVFFGCMNFNQPLNNWDISNKTVLSGAFRGCTIFNQSLNSWQVQNVSLMNNLFYSCTSFDQNISDWEVQNVVSFNQTFFGCTNFNQDIDSWEPLSASDVSLMFYNCTNFNQPLNSWVTTSFVNTSFVFFGCTNFNQPLNNWDLQNSNTFYRMFRGATSFNQPLNNWVTSKVASMEDVFYGCTSFDQNISDWDYSKVNIISGFMALKTFNDYTATYYDDLLIKWDDLGNGGLDFSLFTNVNIGMGTIKYTIAGATARANLVSKGFIISDGGQI